MTDKLLELVKSDLGQPEGKKKRASTKKQEEKNGYWWCCPFHDDKTPSFQVSYYKRGDKWRWKCWGCGKEGDTYDWLMDYRKMTKRDAWRFLHGDKKKDKGKRHKKKVKPVFDYGNEPPAQDWQNATFDIVLSCSVDLPGTPAHAWLQARGLEPATIERYLLGWNAKWREVLPGYWLPPGVVIPSFTREALWYVNVRLTKAEAQKKGAKYKSLKGSRLATLYNAEATMEAQVAAVVEGEFDALLLSQFFAPEELAVVTMGSANATPGPRWKKYLAWLDKLLVVLDKDEAGERGLDKWRDTVKWLEPVDPPDAPGKDITDWWKAGVNLRRWLEPYLVGEAV